MPSSDQSSDQSSDSANPGGEPDGVEPGTESVAPAGATPPWQEPDDAELGRAEPESQLPLTDDDDVALPWLEGNEDEGEYEGYGAGQLLSLVMLGLAVLGLVVGAIWWFTRKGADDGANVADGSTIEAPAQPYKERPENPGGKTFEGTGDTSFAVSEGQTRPARLGQEGQAPAAPPAAASPSAAATAGAKPGFDAVGAGAAATGAATASGVGVQVGAYSTRDAAEAGWTKLVGKQSALSGVSHRVVEGQADIGKVFRLQAVTSDAGTAKALCGKLKAAGVNCQVKN